MSEKARDLAQPLDVSPASDEGGWMRFEIDGPPDWVVDLDNPAAISSDAASTLALDALRAASDWRAAHPLDHEARDSLRIAILAAVRAGVGDSQIAATGRISVDAVRHFCRAAP